MIHRYIWLTFLTLLQFTPQSHQLEPESGNNYHMEMVMSIRETRNGTCAEIKQDSIQLVAAFYYAMSMISRAETYPHVNYFTVCVDFCEIVNSYQSHYQIAKNFYQERDDIQNDTFEDINVFPELQIFLPVNGNQTLFEDESESNDELEDTNSTIVEIIEVSTEVSEQEETIPTTTPVPATTTLSNFFWDKALKVKGFWGKLLQRENLTTTRKRIRVLKLNRTTSTPNVTIPSTESIPEIIEPLEELEVKWPEESNVYYLNISKKWAKLVNPQLTALVEATTTFSVYKDLFLDDYSSNNVPIISNSFEFPPHEAELQTLIGDILECHQWTIISVIYSQTVEEKQRYVNFLQNFQHVCVSEQIGITEESIATDFDHIIWLLHTNIRNTNVILCFCTRKEIEKLIQAVVGYDVVIPFTFIFVQDGLMKQLNFTTGYEEQLLNSYIIGRDINYVEEFNKAYISDYLSAQRLHPWAADFKRQNQLAGIITANDTNKNETDQEFLNNFVVNPEVKGIIVGVFAADAALRTYLQPRTGSKYFNSNVSVMSIWNDIRKGLNSYEKDLNHNLLSMNKLRVARFEKFQNGNVTTYGYTLINNTLTGCINKEVPLHYMNLNIPVERSTVFKYECIESCPHGYESVLKNMHCLVYDPGEEEWEKVRNCTECQKFPEEDVYGHSMMIPMLISVMGLFLTSIVAQNFVIHHQHPVVRTTRNLSAILLACMIIVHSIVILISLKICVFTCGVFKYVIPLCFTIMYSAMLVKINRMYRAWEVSPIVEVVSLPSITSKKSAIILMSALISFESVMIFLYSALSKEKIFHEEYLSTGYEFNLDRLCPLHSDTTMINNFFNAIIVSVTFLYSRVVKSLMQNFYEAKYMHWTMIQTFLLWFAFYALYFNTDLKVLVFSLCVSMNTLLHLLLIFFPKIYIIWYNPDMEDVKRFYNLNDYQLDSSGRNADNSTAAEKKEDPVDAEDETSFAEAESSYAELES